MWAKASRGDREQKTLPKEFDNINSGRLVKGGAVPVPSTSRLHIRVDFNKQENLLETKLGPNEQEDKG